MKLAVLTDGIMPYVMGGMQMHSANLVKHLVLQGVDITLVHCVASGEKIPSPVEVKKSLHLPESCSLSIIGMHFPSSGRAPGHYIRENYKYSVLVYKAIADKMDQLDFVYANGLTGWRILELKRNGQHLPPVGVNFHGYEMFQKGYGLKSRLIKSLFKPSVIFNNHHADVVFSFGGKISAIIEKIGVDKASIIEVPGAIDNDWLRTEELRQDGPRRFIFVGRNERRKGIVEIKRALARLKNRNFNFDFIGPIPRQQQVSAPNIRYYGQINSRNTVFKHLDQSHILVCPSHSEGMPTVILEAMARGLAVIATDVGAVSQLVTADNGVIIEPHQSLKLCQAMEQFIAMSDSELLQMRRNSRKRAEDFLWDHIASQIIEELHRRTHRQ